MEEPQEMTLVHQAMAVIGGVIMYLIILIGIGPVIDMFVFEVAPSMDLCPWAQKLMNEILVFGHWFYILIKLAIALLILWFFLSVFQRYRYIRREDEYDFYR